MITNIRECEGAPKQHFSRGQRSPKIPPSPGWDHLPLSKKGKKGKRIERIQIINNNNCSSSIMSPTKRALTADDEHYFMSPKRLRGGGFDNDDDEDGDYNRKKPAMPHEEDLFDDELAPPGADFEDIPDEILKEVEKGIAQPVQQRWKRPDLPLDFSNATDLNFQWLDIDIVGGKPLVENPNKSRKHVIGSQNNQVPVLRCYGVNEDGHSITAFIHGFTPYAYFTIPHTLGIDKLTDMQEAAIRVDLNNNLKASARGTAHLDSAVIGVKLVRDHQSIFGYNSPDRTFLKVFVALPTLIPALKRMMEDITIAALSPQRLTYAAYECNVPFVLRYMVDRDVPGAGWLTLPAKTYQIRTAGKESHAQVRTSVTL
jgi:DNA polymerase family B, exonuclease domain